MTKETEEKRRGEERREKSTEERRGERDG